MSLLEYQLKVENLPPGTKTNRLKLLFQNTRKFGGGPVKEVQLFEHTHSAIITFEDKSAVQTVLQKGNDVEIQDFSCPVSPIVPLQSRGGIGQAQSPSSNQSPAATSPTVRTRSQAQSSSCDQNPAATSPTVRTRSPAQSSSCDQNPAATSPTVRNRSQGQFEQGAQSFVDGQLKSPRNSQSTSLSSSRNIDKTIQIRINDPTIHKEMLLLYIDDDDIGKYFEDIIFMDGLKMEVYVTFERLEDAHKLCDNDWSGEQHIVRCDMADHEVFDHYNNMLSIHGDDFSTTSGQNKLKEFVKKKTGETVKVKTGEEPQSAILTFNFNQPASPTKLYSIAWKCADKSDNGVPLVTAPVRRSSTILATATSNESKLGEKLVEKYFKTAKQSTGGPIESIESREDGISFIIKFKNVKDAKSVLDKKDHIIGGTINMKVQLWHHCLSKDAYNDYLELQKEFGIDPPTGHSETLRPKPQDYVLLQRKGIDSLVPSQNVVVEPDNETQTITIKGPEKLVTNAKNKINEELLQFQEENLDGFTTGALDFLQEPSVLKMINTILTEGNVLAYVFVNSGKVKCNMHIDGVTAKRITSMIKNHLMIEKVTYPENLMALASNQGKKFISDLHKRSDSPCWIKVDSDKDEVTFFTVERIPHKKQELLCLRDELETYMNENTILSINVPIPDLKLQFASAYLGFDVKTLNTMGAKVKVENGGISVTGPQSAIDPITQEIHSLREKVTDQEEVIKCFGIKEYLTSKDGKATLDFIGKNNKCFLKVGDDLTADGKTNPSASGTSGLVGSCMVANVKVKFVLGDITSLRVNVIVNPIDYKRQCRKGMNKVIVDKGGHEIQQELDAYNGSTKVGTVIETQGGKLHCSAIHHLILKKDEDANNLLSYVTDCLRTADQDGHKSMAMPLLGCGRFRMQKVGASLNVAKAVKNYASKASSINEIIICDQDASHIENIISRFDDVDQVMTLNVDANASGDDDDDSHRKSHHGRDRGGRGKVTGTFGTLNFSMKSGDIVQEKCDVIVCGIKDSMNLSASGAVSKSMYKMCGDSLQSECTQKAEELSQEGAIVTSSHGMSCNAIIFVSMTKFGRCWDRGVKKVLSLADEKGYTSIALPAFGTGAKHADIPKLKSSILDSIHRFGIDKKPQKLKDVRLVIFDKRILNIFHDDGVYDKKSRKKDSKPALPVPAISTAARVHIVYQNAIDGKAAVKELKGHCQEKFSKWTCRDVKMKDESEGEIKELVAIGMRKQVKVSVQNEAIIMESFNKDNILHVQSEIHNFLMKKKDKEHLQEVRSVKTAFKWQFMSRNKWRDFEPEINILIEKSFKKSKDSVEVQDPNGRTYRIDFKTMKEFRVRDRGDEEITTVNRFDLEAGTGKLPSTWDKMASGENLKIVQLANTSKEYQDVEKYFQSKGANVPIKKIERIQNVLLYQQYLSKKNYFERTNPKGTQNEKKLFHGTDPDAVANINESGFNRSFCGKNATMYGKGVYFAENSSYSVGYARADSQGNRMMYQAGVLVGVSTPSNSSMNFLPNQPGKNVPYDSGSGPSMFIIFHDCQAYPEYLITF